MRTSFKLLLLVLLGCTQLFSVGWAQQKNVLFIMADDFNYWLNDYYRPYVQTPHLDSLAKMGIKFTDASCSSPVCNPSRNALWSGYRPSTTKIWKNGNNPDGDFFRDVPGFAEVESMNEYFTNRGYFTFGGGKLYHPGKMGDARTDPNHWSQITTQGTGSSGGNLYKWSGNDASVSWSAGNFDVETTGDRQLAREVASLISGYANGPHSSQPFFIGCGFFRPHLPWNCHKDYVERWDPDTLPFPPGFLASDLNDVNGNPTSEHNEIVNAGEWKNGIRAYLANLAFADDNVGIVMEALSASPHASNTIVVFVGDHGWHLGEKSRWRKFSTWDIANRTSLLIYDPGATGNGQICEKVVSMQDLYPTLAELAGIPSSTVQGNSLTPLLADPSRSDWDLPIFMSYNGTHIIKTNQWRLVDDGNNSQLYDVQADPYEFVNLYGQVAYNHVINDLRGQLANMVNRGAALRDSLQNPTQLKERGALPYRPIIKNPAVENHLLQLDLLYTAPLAELEILDLEGKSLMQLTAVGEQEIPLHLPQLPQGMYMLRVNSEGVTLTEKFLIL